MRKTVFIISHVGSEYEVLISTLFRNSRIIPILNQSQNNYHNLLDVLNAPIEHKFYNKATYFADCILHNHLFSAYDSFDYCKFIYLVEQPRYALPRIIKERPNNNFLFCQRHYLYRIRRMCEMAKRTPQAIFLHSKDIYNPDTYKVIENYLNLNEKLEIPSLKTDYLNIDCVSQNLLDLTESAYEKYLYFLKQQNLVFIN